MVFFGALIVFLLAAPWPRVTAKIGLWFIERLIPHRFKTQVIDLMNKFLDGLASLRSPVNVLMVFFTSVVFWLLETGKYWFVMQAFEFRVGFFALMLLNGYFCIFPKKGSIQITGSNPTGLLTKIQ
ncbi:MAG: hypothetical protein J7L35_01205 [Anaerolineales bacterium]|nr:hypothetical protein [Anaerolineales bacterium]